MIRPDHFPKSIVETETIRMVREAALLSLELHRPVRLIGPPGTGKSCALWQVANEMGGSYCEITAGTKKTKSMLELLLFSIGVKSGKNYASDIEELVYYHFRGNDEFIDGEWRTLPRLLVVDEVQTLEVTAFRELLRVQERCSIGLVLAGNKERLAGGKNDADTLEQINSRILPPWHLPGPTKRDCELIGSTFNVEGTDAYSVLTAYGTATNFRALVHLLEFAQRLTAGAVGIRREHLEKGLKFFKPKSEILKLL
ncbi:AAA family ATPase [Rhizobium lemnae]|uniref:AAA family ATPase n=1 Tax=Rhizobium lemnae TaxID=1214924 RepID=A0ABV8EAR0_9HYPH|nr:AAA family ATPase [Rhizobium lemnae]MCJ8509026.1 AAA family ATPase [Rhizobium lemnae]